jgi:hypothetical protein
MRIFSNERLSALTPACTRVPGTAAAHATVVGLPAVWRTYASLVQEQSVQSIGAPVAGPRVLQLVPGSATDHGTNGFVAQTSGMVKVRKGTEASGIPPRGRPV